MTAAVFLDRDDTILIDTGYMYNLDDFAWRKGVEDSLRLFHEIGLPIFVITNQGGIGRGFFTEAQMHAFHDKLLAKKGGLICANPLLYKTKHPISKQGNPAFFLVLKDSSGRSKGSCG